MIYNFGNFPFPFSSKTIREVLFYDVNSSWLSKKVEELIKLRCLRLKQVENPDHISKLINKLDEDKKEMIEELSSNELSSQEIADEIGEENIELIQYYITYIFEKKSRKTKEDLENN